MALTVTAVLAHIRWPDDANVFGHFTVEEHQKSHFPPKSNIMTVFPGEYKYQSGLPICNVYYPRDP